MSKSENNPSFDSGDELREAAENRYGRSLTPEEWAAVDPDGWSGYPHAEYDENDLEALLVEMARLPPPSRRPVEGQKRAQALASRYRTAAEAKEFVERLRLRLFGVPDPPFKDNGAAAAEWVESQPASRKTTLFALSLACPAGRDSLDTLIWLRDWLETALPATPADDEVERRRIIKLLFQSENSPLRSISYPNPLLEYLAHLESSELAIERVPTDDGTMLDRLRRAAEKLARSEKSERLAALVAEAPTLKWKELWLLWNQRHPAERFPTPDATRRAHRRTRRP